MNTSFSKIKYVIQTKPVKFILGLILGYGYFYWMHAPMRPFYKEEYNCLEIIKINHSTDWKGVPSMILKKNGKIIEHYQIAGYDSDFRKFKIGDRICKTKNSFNFIHIVENGKTDTSVFDGNKALAYIFGFKIGTFEGEHLKCDCLQKQ